DREALARVALQLEQTVMNLDVAVRTARTSAQVGFHPTKMALPRRILLRGRVLENLRRCERRGGSLFADHLVCGRAKLEFVAFRIDHTEVVYRLAVQLFGGASPFVAGNAKIICRVTTRGLGALPHSIHQRLQEIPWDEKPVAGELTATLEMEDPIQHTI